MSLGRYGNIGPPVPPWAITAATVAGNAARSELYRQGTAAVRQAWRRYWDRPAASPPPAQRRRTSTASTAAPQSAQSNSSRSVRRRMPKFRRRRVRPRRKPYAKKRARKSYAKKRTGNFTRYVSPRVPSRAYTTLTLPETYRGVLFHNEETGNSDTLATSQIRPNSVVDPVRVRWGGGSWHYAARGLQQLAALYEKHRVINYACRINIKSRFQTVVNPSANDVYPAVVPSIYFAWRITDDVPGDIGSSTDGPEAHALIVGGVMRGWRYKRIPAYRDRAGFVRASLSIPIRKFYRYRIDGEGTGQTLENQTTDLNTPANWEGPSNPCYIQYVLFSAEQKPISGGVNAPGQTSDGESDDSSSWRFMYELQFRHRFTCYSDERRPDTFALTATSADAAAADTTETAVPSYTADNIVSEATTTVDA